MVYLGPRPLLFRSCLCICAVDNETATRMVDLLMILCAPNIIVGKFSNDDGDGSENVTT